MRGCWVCVCVCVCVCDGEKERDIGRFGWYIESFALVGFKCWKCGVGVGVGVCVCGRRCRTLKLLLGLLTTITC